MTDAADKHGGRFGVGERVSSRVQLTGADKTGSLLALALEDTRVVYKLTELSRFSGTCCQTLIETIVLTCRRWSHVGLADNVHA